MTKNKTAARLESGAAAESKNEELDFSPKPTTKIGTILLAFTRGVSLNRFDAQRYHDHCLNTTVATLESVGIQIAREWERVPCVNGTAQTRVKRYRLETSPRNIAAARNLLEQWRVST